MHTGGASSPAEAARVVVRIIWPTVRGIPHGIGIETRWCRFDRRIMRFDRFLVPPVRLVAVVDVIPVPARTSLLARPLPDLAGGMVIVFTAVVAAPEAAAPEAATIAAAAEAASEYAAKTAGIAPIGVDAPVSRASVVAGTVLVVTVFTVYRVVGFAAAYVTAFELPVEHVAFAIGGRPMVPMRPRLDALQLFQRARLSQQARQVHAEIVQRKVGNR